MGKRKLLKNIANGIINSFISRNNDVYGYWGIGKLCSLMIKSKSMTIEIDLIEKRINPNHDEFNIMINQYSDYLLSHIKRQGLKEEYISKSFLEAHNDN